MLKSVVLCGFMGSGKSTVGHLLAKRLFSKFIDLDTVIEGQQKLSIPEIFAQKGEGYFRALEHVALQTALEAPLGQFHIIATGGGTFMDPDNVALLKAQGENCIVVYISTDFDICYERIKNSDRPLLKSNTLEELRALYNQRHQVFTEICSTQMYNHQKPETVVDNIISLINPLNIQKL